MFGINVSAGYKFPNVGDKKVWKLNLLLLYVSEGSIIVRRILHREGPKLKNQQKLLKKIKNTKTEYWKVQQK